MLSCVRPYGTSFAVQTESISVNMDGGGCLFVFRGHQTGFGVRDVMLFCEVAIMSDVGWTRGK